MATRLTDNVAVHPVIWRRGGQSDLHLHDLKGSRPVIATCFCMCPSPEGGASTQPCLCVLDEEFVTMYMQNGETHTISTPCKARGLWSLPRGMLLEKAGPGALCAAFATAATPAVRPPADCMHSPRARRTRAQRATRQHSGSCSLSRTSGL